MVLFMLNYDDALKLLTSEKRFHIDLGLNRIKEVLEKLGNPQKELKFIHVAGTNGKGSVCAILDSVLREAGYKTGLYTSPHIWEYTERIKINGIDIKKEIFANYVEKISKMNIDLTEFEILTVIAFLYFKENNADIVILETGLGGRLDATNVIDKNICSVITHIDLDHTEILGDTKEKIAFEKAGIIKNGCPVVTSMGYEVIKDKADKLNSLFILVFPSVDKKYINSLSLKGNHQIENLSLAICVINQFFLEIGEEVIINGLKKVKHHCRFEYIKDKNIIIDACHNPNGVEALRNNLDLYYPDKKRRFIFGALKNKNYKKMMEILFREDDEIFFNEFDYPKACSFEELSSACHFLSKKYTSENIITPDRLNIICGSFYMIGKMKFLQKLV